MKSKLFKMLSVLLSLLMMFSMAGCLTEGEEDLPDDKIIIRVQNFFGGFGDEWLNQVKAQFEEDYKNYESPDFPGKKGVYIKKKNNKDKAHRKKEYECIILYSSSSFLGSSTTSLISSVTIYLFTSSSSCFFSSTGSLSKPSPGINFLNKKTKSAIAPIPSAIQSGNNCIPS